ncbi:MAG: glycosyltransferase family 39 protein [Candidatus Omnitrophica bacterium]|nr:glycosyltransferase family 39 protein [Candidatus Omnitrophota bacterium]
MNKYRKEIVLFFLVLSFCLRFAVASEAELTFDENYWIGYVKHCSVEDGKINFVWHGSGHPALAVYLIKLSTVIFGESVLGHRLMNLYAGVLTVWMLYLISMRWFGFGAAVWTLILATFNEYLIGISAIATAKSYYFLFASAGIYLFYRGLEEKSKQKIYGSGFFVGLAFLSSEISALLIVAFALFLLCSKYRFWFKRKEIYFAALIFFVVISPDICFNITNQTPDHDGLVNYLDHFKRIGRIGFSIHPFAFYFSDFYNGLLTPRGLWENMSPEYPAPNGFWGFLCFAGTIFALFVKKQPLEKILLIIFFLVFGILLFLTWVPDDPVWEAGLVKVEWVWCAITLIPALLLTAHKIAQIKERHSWLYFFIILFVMTAVYKTFMSVSAWQ